MHGYHSVKRRGLEKLDIKEYLRMCVNIWGYKHHGLGMIDTSSTRMWTRGWLDTFGYFSDSWGYGGTFVAHTGVLTHDDTIWEFIWYL